MHPECRMAQDCQDWPDPRDWCQARYVSPDCLRAAGHCGLFNGVWVGVRVRCSAGVAPAGSQTQRSRTCELLLGVTGWSPCFRARAWWPHVCDCSRHVQMLGVSPIRSFALLAFVCFCVLLSPDACCPGATGGRLRCAQVSMSTFSFQVETSPPASLKQACSGWTQLKIASRVRAVPSESAV
jgi:hypothetical protein